MNDYDRRTERTAAEADFDVLGEDEPQTEDISTVVSVRLRGVELETVERAAQAAGMPLSTFIRQAAFGAASPLDMRAASAQAETIQAEVHKLRALLQGHAA